MSELVAFAVTCFLNRLAKYYALPRRGRSYFDAAERAGFCLCCDATNSSTPAINPSAPAAANVRLWFVNASLRSIAVATKNKMPAMKRPRDL